MFSHFRKVNEFTRTNSGDDRLWRFCGGQKTSPKRLPQTPKGSIVVPVKRNAPRGAQPNETEFTMTAAMSVRAYAIQFTEDNLYSTYEYLHRRGAFCPLVRDVDPEGYESVVPEGNDT